MTAAHTGPGVPGASLVADAADGDGVDLLAAFAAADLRSLVQDAVQAGQSRMEASETVTNILVEWFRDEESYRTKCCAPARWNIYDAHDQGLDVDHLHDEPVSAQSRYRSWDFFAQDLTRLSIARHGSPDEGERTYQRLRAAGDTFERCGNTEKRILVATGAIIADSGLRSLTDLTVDCCARGVWTLDGTPCRGFQIYRSDRLDLAHRCGRGDPVKRSVTWRRVGRHLARL